MAKTDITKTDSAELADLKMQYLSHLSRPVDGMWETFVNLGDHYLITGQSDAIGYCVVNADRKLLQFSAPSVRDARGIFGQVLKELGIVGAFVATCEARYLSLCMDQQQSVTVNALMYHLESGIESGASVEVATFPGQSVFRIVDANELKTAVDFCTETLNANPDWLNGYLTERIKKEELFGLWAEGLLIATGECRPSQTQRPYADLGMVVSKLHRRQGIATGILRQLISQCQQKGLRPICSTERENLGAQKAISDSGFISQHRILDVGFQVRSR